MSNGDGGKRIAQLIRAAGATHPPPRWRMARLAAILGHCSTVLGDEFAYVAYTLAHFGSGDLAQLTDSQLVGPAKFIQPPLPDRRTYGLRRKWTLC